MGIVTEAAVATAVGSIALGLILGWLAWQAATHDPHAPERLVTELRLAQMSALLLTLAAGVYFGFAIAHEDTPGTGLDIAIAVGFFMVAAISTTWEPSRALTMLALAWGAHALVDLAHGTNTLPAAIVPSWYVTACAIYDVCIAGLCYLPLLRR